MSVCVLSERYMCVLQILSEFSVACLRCVVISFGNASATSPICCDVVISH